MLVMLVKAQPYQQVTYSADLYLEPITFRNDIRITSWYINPNYFSPCDTQEFGLSIGQNLILTSSTKFVNMGYQDFVCDLHNPYCDSNTFSYMSCHGHMHIANFQQFYLKDRCGNIVRQNNKVGFNMGSNSQWPYMRMFNYMTGLWQVLRVASDEQWTELTRYCTPDSSIAFDPTNPYANADDYQVVDVGFSDTYGYSYRGQGVVINGLPDGEYIFGVRLEPPHCMINEGANCYPNMAEYPVSIVGTTVTLLQQLDYSQPQTPSNVDPTDNGTTVTVQWGAIGDFCKFEVVPVAVKGNSEKSLDHLKVVVTQNRCEFSTSLLRAAWRGFWSTGKIRYRFDVVSVNGALKSPAARNQQTLNLN